MNKFLFISFSIILLSGYFQKPKSFPDIHYVTNEGKLFTNENFKGRKTIVLLFHLGCPPAMYLLKDLDSLNMDSNDSVQIIGVLENTPSQINAFNDTTANDWSEIRNYFHMKPVEIPLIGECDKEDVTKDENGNTIIGVQCRILSKTIKTKMSPTLVYVSPEGKIEKIKKGYLSLASPLEQRIAYLLDK